MSSIKKTLKNLEAAKEPTKEEMIDEKEQYALQLDKIKSDFPWIDLTDAKPMYQGRAVRVGSYIFSWEPDALSISCYLFPFFFRSEEEYVCFGKTTGEQKRITSVQFALETLERKKDEVRIAIATGLFAVIFVLAMYLIPLHFENTSETVENKTSQLSSSALVIQENN